MIIFIIKYLLFLLLGALPVGRAVFQKIGGKDSFPFVESLVIGQFVLTLGVYLSGLIGIYQYRVWVVLGMVGLGWIGSRWKKDDFRFRIKWAVIITILFSVYVNSLLLVPFGKLTPSGMSITGAHYVDSTWHLALINSLGRSFPPENPLYSGTYLTNYHLLSDMQISIIQKFTSIPTSDLFFRIIGPAYILFLSILVYKVGKTIGGTVSGLASILFIMLSSNWYYLASLSFPFASIQPSVAWVEFFSTKTVNFPLLFSLTIVLALLPILTGSIIRYLPHVVGLGVLSGALFGVKSHTALAWTAGLSWLGLWELVQKRKYILITACVSIVILAMYSVLLVSGTGSSLEFNPFWFIRVMYESPEHLNHSDWELRRQTLISLNSTAGIAKLYIQGVAWFTLLNFGAFLPGVISLGSRSLSNQFKILAVGCITAGAGATLLFIYQDTAIVTIQFIYISLFFLAFLTAHLMGNIYKRAPLIGVGVMIIMWLTLLPGVKVITSSYISRIHHPDVSASQVSLLEFLSALPPSIAMVDEYFYSGSYIPGYTSITLYRGDSQILEGLGVDLGSRSLKMEEVCSKRPPVEYVISSVPIPGNCVQLLFSEGAYVYRFTNTPQSKFPQGIRDSNSHSQSFLAIDREGDR